MTLTYADAMAIVDANYRPLWGGSFGTFYVSPEGEEDDEAFLVPWGAREYLVDDDLNYLLINNTVTLVMKATGEIEQHNTPLIFDRLNAMRPVTA